MLQYRVARRPFVAAPARHAARRDTPYETGGLYDLKAVGAGASGAMGVGSAPDDARVVAFDY